MKRSKSYKNKIELIKEKTYDKKDAFILIKKLSGSKFNGSIEAHINLNLTEKEKTQPVRATINYKYPFGETKKILVFVEPAQKQDALDAGADYAGLEDYVKKIQEGWLDFDIVLAHPSVISKVAQLGKILGTRGLMPNIKNGTVSANIPATIKDFKGGRTNIKSDSYGIIHALIGKTSNKEAELEANYDEVFKSIMTAMNKTDNSAIKSIFLSPTMGPSIKVNLD